MVCCYVSRLHNYQRLSLILIVVACVIGVSVFFYSRYKLPFSPSLFVNEMFKFFLSLISIIVSFILGTVHWQRISINRRTKRLQSFLHVSNEQIIQTIMEVHNDLSNSNLSFRYERLRFAKWQLEKLQALAEKGEVLISLLYDIDMTFPIWDVLFLYGKVNIVVHQIQKAIEEKNEPEFLKLADELYELVSQVSNIDIA